MESSFIFPLSAGLIGSLTDEIIPKFETQNNVPLHSSRLHPLCKNRAPNVNDAKPADKLSDTVKIQGSRSQKDQKLYLEGLGLRAIVRIGHHKTVSTGLHTAG